MRLVGRWGWAVVVGVAALGRAGAAQGQGTVPLDSVKLGAMVRVRTAEREFKGSLLARTASVIEIKPGFDIKTARTPDTTFAVLRSRIREGAVRTGSRWRTGAIVGSIFLAVSGGSLACLLACGDEEISDDASFILLATGFGAVVGGTLGGIVGHFFKVWMPLEGVSLGVNGRG